MNFDRSLTRRLLVPAIITGLLFTLAVVTYMPRSMIAALALLGSAICGMFSLSVMPVAFHLLVTQPAYRNLRNISCVIAGLVPAFIGILFAAALTWAVFQICLEGSSLMSPGLGA